MSSRPAVTAIVVSYNRRTLVAECLEALLAQTCPVARILLVDNASPDGTADHVRQTYPSVEVIDMPVNRGPNPARNRGLREARTDLVLLVDDDAQLAPDALEHLVAAMDADVAVTSPVAVRPERLDEVQYRGFRVHYLCLGVPAEPPAGGRPDDPYPVTTVAGVATLVRKSVAERVGLYDEDLFFGRTDGEFASRVTQAGFRCLQVPRAVVRHAAQPRSRAMVYYHVRNRWLYMLRLYSVRTLILVSPALLAYEVALATLLCAKGELSAYLRGNAAVLRALPTVWPKRRATQAIRRLRDQEWLSAGAVMLPERSLRLDSRASRAARALNGLLDAYWRLVRRYV